MSVFTEELTPPQLQAVESFYGPHLILAGAGSGKTRALTYRMAYMVLEGVATPGQILAVTFTNKAAQEMKERTLALLHRMNVRAFESPWVSTFHSLCARILRQYITLLGYEPAFVIYNESDQLSMIKKTLRKLNIDAKIHNPKGIQFRVNTAKNLGLAPTQVETQAPYLMDERDMLIYSEYERDMKAANALDFSDLLYKTHKLFKVYPKVLGVFQEKFQYIMVDEYQDTNHIQYLLVRLLSAAHRNICVVGDEDQSIYSWRGADINNILDFEKDFPATRTIKLEENHRSTKNIVEAASSLIANNSQRKNKVLFTHRHWGDPIVICGQFNDHKEAQYVVQTLSSLRRKGFTYRDCAIFYRTNAQSRVLEDQLRHHSIPYNLVGGMKFYDRKEIKDILGYMQLALNPRDDIVARRIINTPTRGIGKTTIEALEVMAQEKGLSWLETCQLSSETKIFPRRAGAKLYAFYDLMENLRRQVHVKGPDQLRLSEIYHLILELTEYGKKLRAENTTESLARIDNLEEFNNAIVQFEEEEGEEATLAHFLEKMSLVSNSDTENERADAVTLMTLHVSKGLEYSNVFIVGMEEGLFPTFQSIEEGAGQIEEERRLAYVGMTRAREKLFLSYAQMRKVWGTDRSYLPSRFIQEIPEKYIKWKNPPNPQPPRLVKKPVKGTYSCEYEEESMGPSGDFAFGDFDRIPVDESEGFSYKRGMKVRHPKFGVGSIHRLEGRGEKLKVSVMFANQRVRKFVVKYAPLELL